MNAALEKLRTAQDRNQSLLSIGLEPSPDYLFPGMTASADGFKAFLRTIVNATRDLCCAYKFNIAFFEALGSEGIDILHDVRGHLPDDVLIILDGKRGDIGTTARRYAVAYYDVLKADAVTLNPLMGFDSAEPFLEYTDKLNFFLGLTSNPGAVDFLMRDGLYLEIARTVEEWNEAGNCGLVVGATQAAQVAAIRHAAPTLPFLVPGVGAQGGEVGGVAREGRLSGGFSGLIFHVTRGILPDPNDNRDPQEVVRQKALLWRNRITAESSAEEGTGEEE